MQKFFWVPDLQTWNVECWLLVLLPYIFLRFRVLTHTCFSFECVNYCWLWKLLIFHAQFIESSAHIKRNFKDIVHFREKVYGLNNIKLFFCWRLNKLGNKYQLFDDQHKCLPHLACINPTPLLFQKFEVNRIMIPKFGKKIYVHALLLVLIFFYFQPIIQKLIWKTLSISL